MKLVGFVDIEKLHVHSFTRQETGLII